MRIQHETLMVQLENYISKSDYHSAFDVITNYPEVIFDVPRLNGLLKLMDKIPDSEYTIPLHKLIKAWVCFLCGENYYLTKVLSTIHEENLQNARESSLFYGLKALASFMTHQDDSLRYAKLSVDVFEDSQDIFYLANAKLTYGQLLSSVYRVQEAAVEFYSAYHLFKTLGCDFLSTVAIINYGLKKHSIGQIFDILQIFNDEITANSRVSGHDDSFFDTLKLPLGIAYFELNKQTNAVEYLECARSSIFQLDYVHMYGTLELYLCYAYAALERFSDAKTVLNELIDRVGKLNSKNYDALFAILRIDICLLEGGSPSKSDIEFLEVYFLMNGERSFANTLLTLARLNLNGLSEAIGLNELKNLQALLDKSSNLPLLQSTCLLIAEFYLKEGNSELCEASLMRAVSIYNETKMCSRFHLEKLECLKYLGKLSPLIHSQLTVCERQQNSSDTQKDSSIDALTSKELEILAFIAAGDSNQDIARKLFISVGTTKWHISNIFSKLQIKRRSQAAAYYHNLNTSSKS